MLVVFGCKGTKKVEKAKGYANNCVVLGDFFRFFFDVARKKTIFAVRKLY